MGTGAKSMGNARSGTSGGGSLRNAGGNGGYGERRGRLLPLKNDLVFKLIFGDYRYVAIIRAFLIAALYIPAEEYEELEIIDPHLERDSPYDKLGILDVRVRLRNKKLISVEIQVRKMPFMAERAAFSAGSGLSRKIAPGQTYARIERVVTIVIADYGMIDADEHYHHVFKLYDPDKRVLFTDVMEIHTFFRTEGVARDPRRGCEGERTSGLAPADKV
jgi:predicted transposase/invertase (TIGR01784 family)